MAAHRRDALEAAVRDSDGGAFSKHWPDLYAPAIDAVLAALEPEEQLLAAWRISHIWRNQHGKLIGGIGLLVVTDRRVLERDHSGKRGGFSIGGFDVPADHVAWVGKTESAVDPEICLLDRDGFVLGKDSRENGPASFTVCAKGRDTGGFRRSWRNAEELVEVERQLVQLLPSARVTRREPRRKQLPDSDEIKPIVLDSSAFQPGDQVTGTVMLPLGPTAGVAQIELREVSWHNEKYSWLTPVDLVSHHMTGDAPDSDAVVDTEVVSAVELPLGPQDQYRFSITVPDDAPPSTHDPAIRKKELRDLVSWQLCLTIDGSASPESIETIQICSGSGQYRHLLDAESGTNSSSTLEIRVEPERRLVRPGELISGTVFVTPLRSGALEVGDVRVELQQRRADGGPTFVEVRCQLSGPTQLVAGQSREFRFELELSDDAPPTFIGQHNALGWFVVGIVDRKGMRHYRGEAPIVVYTGDDANTPPS